MTLALVGILVIVLIVQLSKKAKLEAAAKQADAELETARQNFQLATEQHRVTRGQLEGMLAQRAQLETAMQASAVRLQAAYDQRLQELDSEAGRIRQPTKPKP